MTTKDELLKQALDFLEDNQHYIADNERHAYVMEYNAFITTLRTAIEAAEEQEPLAYAVYHRMGGSKTLHWPEQHSEDGDAKEYKLVPLYTTPPAAQPAPDYAWPTIADYEKDVGFKVNEAFRMAWNMARTTNALFKKMEKNT